MALIELYFLLENRVQLGDHDLGPLLDGLKTPTDYVLAGKFFFGGTTKLSE